MAKKKAKAKKTSSSSPAAGGTSSAASNAANPTAALTGIGSDISNAIGGVLSPITGFFGQLEADVINTMNQVFNSLFYGFAALVGVALVVVGVVMLFMSTDTGKQVGEAAAVAALI